MTYKKAKYGNYTKLFDASRYSSDLPESVDWRTNNAVTNIKDQVCVCVCVCVCLQERIHSSKYFLTTHRACVVLAMLSVL